MNPLPPPMGFRFRFPSRFRKPFVLVLGSLVTLALPLPFSLQAIAQEATDPPGESIRAGGITFQFASVDRGGELLKQHDEYVRNLSSFDRKARMRAETDPGTEAFVEFVADHVIEWTPDERAGVGKAIMLLGERINNLQLPIEIPVLLVHTTGREESGAAYTRDAAIVLPRGRTGSSDKPPLRLLAHELFHVLSRLNPSLRDELYAIIGFRPIGVVELPGALADRKITNPDAPQIAHAIDVRLPDDRTVSLAPVLLAKREFDPGQPSLFSYLEFKLMEVQQNDRGDWFVPLIDGEPVLHEPSLADFHRQIGGNTGYIIHPDEVLAENFAILVTGEEAKDPWILDAMRDVFEAHAKPTR